MKRERISIDHRARKTQRRATSSKNIFILNSESETNTNTTCFRMRKREKMKTRRNCIKRYGKKQRQPF